MMLGVNYIGPGPSQDHPKRWKDKEKKALEILLLLESQHPTRLETATAQSCLCTSNEMVYRDVLGCFRTSKIHEGAKKLRVLKGNMPF
jgi:hypothetical protein